MRKPILYLLALVAIFVFLSCDKSDDPQPTAKNVEELLALHTWKLEEYRFNQNNVLTYYKRGVTSNGAAFDPDSIKLKTDFTGTYYNAAGVTTNFTWSFQDNEKTKMKLTLSPTFSVNWENMSVTETALRYTEYFVIPNTATNSLGGAYRTKR